MIKLVKLLTGEEIVTRVKEDDSNVLEYIFVKPAIIIVTQDGKVGLLPWLALSEDDEVTIKTDHVLFITEPQQDLVNGYNAQFGSGIVTASVLPPDPQNKPSLKIHGD